MNTALIRIRRFFSILPLLIAVIVIITSLQVQAEDVSGFVPSEESRTKYAATTLISELPKTYEVTVRMPIDYSTAYAICASSDYPTVPSFSLSVNTEGHPVFTVYEGVYENTVKKSTTVFDEVDMRTGEWEHLAITLDSDNSQLNCYLGGVLVAARSVEISSDAILEAPILVGGSYSRSSFFGGEILNVALYSDARNAYEIAADFSEGASGDDMLCRYDFSGFDNATPPLTVRDLSPKGNDLTLYSEFYDEPVNELSDYAYSFAIVGDIQTITCNAPDKLHYIYDWIIDNKDDKKIAFTFNLGDFTEYNTDKEWKAASDAIHTLDGIVPYSIVRGNHDKSEEKYKEYFKYSDYEDVIGGTMDGSMLDTYQTFTVSGNKYLVLNLDYRMTYRTLYWATDVVESHPDHNVIVTTHVYLHNDGTTLEAADSGSPEEYGSYFDAEQLWDEFVSIHKNIVLVISGHKSTSAIITSQRTGVHGNTVTQILVDPQYEDLYYKGRVGLVAMLYFSADGIHVETQYYSTVKEQYFSPNSEYEITLDPIQNGEEVEPAHDLSEEYSYSDVMHWKECVCERKQNEQEHTLGEWTVAKRARISESGIRYRACICGYEISEKYEWSITDNITVIIIGIGALALASAVLVTVVVKKRKRG